MAIEKINSADLSVSTLQLIECAKKVMSNAYNVYSHFYVGAAARTISGKIYSGTNVENASLGLSVCAEPAALLLAISAGDPEVIDMAVVGGTSPDTKGGRVATPCGRCRQIIYEVSQISKTDIMLYCCNPDLSEILRMTISDLLPLPFGPKDLGVEKEVENYLGQLRSTISEDKK
ncbi:MAG: cytidine deaminase [Calditrichaeota bacterium]|nr:cytidine deaminase [Calditrichota bacterium]